MSSGTVAVALVIILILGAGGFYLYKGGYLSSVRTPALPAVSTNNLSSTTSSGSTTLPTSSTASSSSTTSPAQIIADPSFSGGTANITYPSDYQALASFALSIIDQDRAANGLPPVSLSKVPSGQQHADSMLYFGYFSHWDVQGYKPYMRYTLLGGTGAVEENIGMDYCTNSAANSTEVHKANCDTATEEAGVNNSEWAMMNNDLACCNNAHRDNILDPLHTSVSIGIAYNSSTSVIYFVEDFENSYLIPSVPILNSGDGIVLDGGLSQAEQVSQIQVYYDPTPQPMNVSALDATSAYTPGTFVGGVFPPCSVSCSYYPGQTSVYATTWNVSSGAIDIAFSMANFFQANGAGVYTIYVLTGSSTSSAILAYSVFDG